MPLLILVTDGYWGLTAGAWFQEGGLAAAILFVLCMIISRIIFFASKKLNLFQWWEEKSQKYQLQLIYVRKVGITVLFTFILQGVFNYIADPPMFVSGTVFENYEDVQAYMEKGCQILNIINVVWVAAYVVEIALGAGFYWKKKRIHE